MNTAVFLSLRPVIDPSWNAARCVVMQQYVPRYAYTIPPRRGAAMWAYRYSINSRYGVALFRTWSLLRSYEEKSEHHGALGSSKTVRQSVTRG